MSLTLPIMLPYSGRQLARTSRICIAVTVEKVLGVERCSFYELDLLKKSSRCTIGEL